ncbi:MAG: 60S ribosomal export protein NMD3 [Ignisphaera sp.]
MRKFCSKCGKEEDLETPIIDNLCVKCYTQTKKLLEIPRLIEVTSCSRCGAISIGNRWFYPDTSSKARYIIEQYIASLVEKETDIDIENLSIELDDTSSKWAKIYVDILIKNTIRYTIENTTEIKWKKSLCPICFKRAGGGFEAIVQLRFMNYEDRVEKFKNEILQLFHDYVVEISDVKNGIDIKIASRSIAKKIADIALRMWRNVRIVESFGDVRRMKNGSRHGKQYISIKIINPREGDYIVLDGKAYIVDKVYENGIDVVNSNGEKIFVSLDELLNMCSKMRKRTR